MALKEEIFEQNSTLFAVLDENEVTEIGEIRSSVTNVQAELDQQKLQLDGLARVVDSNQARNEEQFVNFNTMLIATNSEVDKLKTSNSQLVSEVSSLSANLLQLESESQSRFDTVFTRLNSLETKVDKHEMDIAMLQTDSLVMAKAIEDLSEQSEYLSNKVDTLDNSVSNNSLAITSLSSRVTQLESAMNPYLRSRQQYTIIYYNNSPVVRILGFWTADEIAFGQPFSVRLRESAPISTTITLLPPEITPNLGGTPVLEGSIIRSRGSYPIGSNTFEPMNQTTPVVIYRNQELRTRSKTVLADEHAESNTNHACI